LDSIILRSAFYLLALINPASKIFLLSAQQPPFSRTELTKVALRSTVVAFIILGTLAWTGDFILTHIFQVKLYSLRVAGSVVLFLVGLSAVRNGRFYEESAMQNLSDISIVPLAAPLIAGPGTITAAISYASIHGLWITVLSLSMALIVNLLGMLASRRIGRLLEKVNAIGPLVRITGLIVMAVAVQMLLTGVGDWVLGLQ
jgi:multiple antibiotic resistance protein